MLMVTMMITENRGRYVPLSLPSETVSRRPLNSSLVTICVVADLRENSPRLILVKIVGKLLIAGQSKNVMWFSVGGRCSQAGGLSLVVRIPKFLKNWWGQSCTPSCGMRTRSTPTPESADHVCTCSSLECVGFSFSVRVTSLLLCGAHAHTYAFAFVQCDNVLCRSLGSS